MLTAHFCCSWFVDQCKFILNSSLRARYCRLSSFLGVGLSKTQSLSENKQRKRISGSCKTFAGPQSISSDSNEYRSCLPTFPTLSSLPPKLLHALPPSRWDSQWLITAQQQTNQYFSIFPGHVPLLQLTSPIHISLDRCICPWRMRQCCNRQAEDAVIKRCTSGLTCSPAKVKMTVGGEFY